jgi:hypothetical protein
VRSLVENRVGNGVEQGLQESELADQFHFDFAAVGDIEDGNQQRVELAAFVADGGNLDIAPACRAVPVEKFKFTAQPGDLPACNVIQRPFYSLPFRWREQRGIPVAGARYRSGNRRNWQRRG